MNLEQIEKKISDALSGIKVIDAHEHLIPEKRRVARKVDFFLLFSHYTEVDFLSAGMTLDEYRCLRDDGKMPIEEKWKTFSRFYPMIKYGSYARPALIWLKEVLGYDELTEKNYKEVSEKLQEGNKPGLYNRILRKMCHIESALVCTEALHGEYNLKLLKPFWVIPGYALESYIERFVETLSNTKTGTLERYLNWMEKEGEELFKIGIFGIKAKCYPLDKPNMKRAEAVFKILRDKKNHGMSVVKKAPLISVIYDRAFQFARKHRLTVAVHSGVWGDFREIQPAYLIPMAMNYSDISFDLFHLGLPYAREAVMIGKMFPNVSLNLCWTSVISPELTVRMLDECLDMVPINNLIVFGGDYALPVEKVYGHLKMAKENVARTLSKRIKRGCLDFEGAEKIAKMWFYDNPVRIYNL